MGPLVQLAALARRRSARLRSIAGDRVAISVACSLRRCGEGPDKMVNRVAQQERVVRCSLLAAHATRFPDGTKGCREPPATTVIAFPWRSPASFGSLGRPSQCISGGTIGDMWSSERTLRSTEHARAAEVSMLRVDPECMQLTPQTVVLFWFAELRGASPHWVGDARTSFVLLLVPPARALREVLWMDIRRRSRP